MATFKVLVIGGGGGGGTNSAGVGNDYPGGGGAGGYQYDASHSLSDGTYNVTVGAGGAINTNGQNSIFDTITAYGGGYGGHYVAGSNEINGNSGGSGGGGSSNTSGYHSLGGAASQGQAGGDGYYNSTDVFGGGGGGAGGVGGTGYSATTGNPGGNGIANSITGTSVYYAGGGGSWGVQSGTTIAYGVGGLGGGGSYASAGTNGLGGGGGGNAAGGSGVVIMSFITANFGSISVTGTGNTATINGLNTICTFINSGTITFNSTSYIYATTGYYSLTGESITAGFLGIDNGVYGSANVSDYKWLSKTLKTAQQQTAVRPYYECRIIDDSILGNEVVTLPYNTTEVKSVCVAPDGQMFALGTQAGDIVGVWIGDPSTLQGVSPTKVLETNSHNTPNGIPLPGFGYSGYSISCSDWWKGTYKVDAYFFGNWDSYYGSYITIVHYYSIDKGITWKTDQTVNNTTITPTSALAQNMCLVAGKPYIEKESNGLTSLVFYLLANGTDNAGNAPYLIQYQELYNNLGVSGIYSSSVSWSSADIDSVDWIIHSFDVNYINGYFYIIFSAYHDVIEGSTNNSTNQNGTEYNVQNYNLYITKIVSLLHNLQGVNDIWTPAQNIISSLSTSILNQNSFTYPSLFYDNTYLWLMFNGQIVNSIQNSNGQTNVVVNNNLYLCKSKDLLNFNYPVPFVDNTGIMFNSIWKPSFFLQGSYYWFGVFGYLGNYIINSTVADVSEDILSYECTDTQDNPSTISINIGNANNKWRGASPTQSGYQAIANNKKICLFQGYYNASGVAELAPKNTYLIDDIQQDVQYNKNDFSLLGRDFYKNLNVLKTRFLYSYDGIRKYIDLFDGTTISNWSQISDVWSEEIVTVSGGGLAINSFHSSPATNLAMFNLYQSIKANTIISLSILLPDPSTYTSSTPNYIYFIYSDANNWARLKLYANGYSTAYYYAVERSLAGVVYTNAYGTFNIAGSSPNNIFPFLFVKHDNSIWDIYVGEKTNRGFGIEAFQNSTLLYSSFQANNYSAYWGLTNFGFGGLNIQTTVFNFKYLEFDYSMNISEMIKKIGTLSGIFDYKLPTIFEDLFFDTSNYTGSFTIQNRTLELNSSFMTYVMKNDMQISDGEIEFLAKTNGYIGASELSFQFIFRSNSSSPSSQTENYFFQIYQNTSTHAVSISLWNTHLGVSYIMGEPATNFVFDFTQYHIFKVSFISGYIFLSIDGIVVYGWFDNNITDSTSIHNTGYIGVGNSYTGKTLDSCLYVKSIKGNDLYQQIPTFSINPGDDLQSSVETLLASQNLYYFSDLMARFKIKRLSSSDVSNYTYQDAIITQQVDNSDKEYVNQVTVIGDGVQAVVQNTNSIQSNAIVREEVIVDYTILTYTDALTRANTELVSFNKYNNQYSPTVINNLGSEMYDVVNIIDTGSNSSNVNQTVRIYSINSQVGGNNVSYWQTIQTGSI